MAITGDVRAAPPERVIARLRPHARALFWPSLVLIATCAAVGYFGGTFTQPWENTLVFAAAGAIALLLFLLPLVMWLSKRYIITTRRVILRRGFFVRVRQELLHSRGYDVSVSRGPLQSIFRSGTVVINAGLERPFVLHDVPRAETVKGALHELMEHSNVVAPGNPTGTSEISSSGMWGAR